MDEMECGNLFDQIDDLIEFPPDNGESGDGKLVGSKDFPTWDEALQDCDPLFSCSSASDLAADLSVPYEDIVQMEWLSTFVEDSFSDRGLSLGQEDSTHNQFQTSSPVSLVESSSSSSTSSSKGKTQRARSKRPRPPAFNPRPPIHLISPSASPHLSESDSFADSESLPLKKKKTKNIKISPPAANQDHPVRKCLHCEITKTPQWRAGPMGPKTLCNACGVRFKSGRLFPEYRPAASPTFVPALHSNSHKKVVEMRSKFQPTQTTTAQSELLPKASL